MGSYETLTVEPGRVTTITVARPAAMNALNRTVLAELAGALDTAADDGTRVVVVTGAGNQAFVVGADITEFDGRDGQWFLSEFRPALRRVERAIEEHPAVVIAAVNGYALGGGMELSMMCDLVIAAESARFGQPEIGLGIIPGAGGTQRLTRLVGAHRAKEIVLTGRHVPAAEAVELGLANEAVPDDDLRDRVREIAEDLADGAPLAQRAGKAAVNRARPALDEGLDYEAALVSTLFDTQDKHEGVRAFLDDRDPVFEGR